MEKYINDLKQKYAALDKEVEGRIKEFLTNAVNYKWNICVYVNLRTGEVLKVLPCLPDNETCSRLNDILEKDNLYKINDRLLKSYPYYHKDLGKIVKFEIMNRSLLLTNEEGYVVSDKTADFNEYLDDATYSLTIRADFFRIMSNIMESDDTEEIWNKYNERIIEDIRECSGWHYNDSDVRIAITNLLKAKLLYE